MESAIVLDGHIKSALATIRSLGAKNIAVSAGAVRGTAMGIHSRYTQHAFIYPSPYVCREEFVESVLTEARRLGGKPVVYAFSDATFLALYASREILKNVVTIDFPDEHAMQIAFDKAATYSLARVSGVPTITTHIPETGEELVRTAHSLTYPAVLKTRRSVSWKEGKGIFGSATFVHTKEELVSSHRALKEKVGESPLIQVFVRGEEYGVAMLAREGRVYARVVHHRIRSLSPTGGASVLKETMFDGDLKQTLISHAQTLVEKLSWTGPLMVEFKVDADTREPYLMEINGRFWGSLPLAVFAGVDMPFLYHNALTGNSIPNQKVEGREGVTSGHFLGDLLHLKRVLFAQDQMRNILYPRRLTAIRDFIFLPRGTRDDVWQFSDIKPAFMEIIDTIAKSLQNPT